MIDLENECRSLESLLRDVLPIDCPERVYILTPDEAGPEFCKTWATAFTSCGCDLRLKPRLEDLGLWAGPGFAMVFCDIAEFAWRPLEARLGVVLHELAHHLWYRWVLSDLTPAEEASLTGTPPNDPTFYPERMRTPEESAAAKLQFPWGEHGAEFTRIALHLRYRAAMNSYDVPLAALHVGGPRYALSPAEDYAATLGDEPRRRIDEPVVKIIKDDHPEAFASLFFDDLKRFLEPRIRAEIRAELSRDPRWVPRLAALLDPAKPTAK